MKGVQENQFTCNQQRLPHVLNREQLERIISVVDDINLIAVIFFGIFMGLRVGEIVRLKWENVDLEDESIRVVDAKNVKRFKSGYGKDRKVPIMNEFIPFIKEWRAMNPHEEYVIPFPNKESREGWQNKLAKSFIKNLQDKFAATLKKLNLMQVAYYQKDGKPRYKYHLHTLRHVCGCNLRRCGLGIEYIRDFLGHKKIDDTMIYTELTKDDLKASVSKALNYPTNYSTIPQTELPQPDIQVTPDKEMLRLQTEYLRLMVEMKNTIGGVGNAYMPQQKVRE